MQSVCFHLGPLTVHWYGVMMALGFLAGLGSWSVVGRREGRTFAECSDLLFWIMVSGIFGARAAYIASEWSHYKDDPAAIVRVDQGGLIFYGGLFAAALVLYVYARVRKERFLSLVDFVITSLPLAHAFGRVGCFMNGCCYGKPWDGPWAVRFPAESLVWWDHVMSGKVLRFTAHSLPVHPVQLYEALFNLAVYGVVVWRYRTSKRAGSTTAAYLLTYPVGRFVLEFFRGHEREYWFGLPVAQVVSIGLFLSGLALLLWIHRFQGDSVSKQAPRTAANASTGG